MPRHFSDVEAMVAALAPEEPVYCLRPEILRRSAAAFLSRFPGRVLYAVKANPAEIVLDELYGAGIRHFDTASRSEIELIKTRFPEATAYFMHPVKAPAAIRAAYGDHGVRHFVIDQIDELDKIDRALGGLPADLTAVVRLATPGSGAVFDLSAKFGATPQDAVRLLQAATQRGCRAGLAFHVGSQCTEPQAFDRAFALAREVLAEAGVTLACLDVGGGFPVAYVGAAVPPLEAFMAAIDAGLAGLAGLALPADCAVMCEPGRVLVAEAQSLVVQVHLRRGRALYLNDGVYGSLHGARIGYRYPVRLLRPGRPVAPETTEFRLFGPTCDGLDVLAEPFLLPADTGQGDWIEFGMNGAYSNALRTGFNGFYPETLVTVDQPFRATDPIKPEEPPALTGSSLP